MIRASAGPESKLDLARQIDTHIADWFKRTGREEAKPKDVMPFLVERGIFRADHREGLPLRKLLRELDRSGDLSIMTTVRFEQRPKNKLWYFVPPGISRPTPPRQLRAEGPAVASQRVGRGWRVSVDWRGREVETLADIVAPDLRALFVGLNPSPVSVAAGHYHQGRLGKQFWQVLVSYGVLTEPAPGQFHDDSLLSLGFGITDLVKVPSARADKLDTADITAGRAVLLEKIAALRPRIVCSVYKRAIEELCEKEVAPSMGTAR